MLKYWHIVGAARITATYVINPKTKEVKDMATVRFKLTYSERPTYTFSRVKPTATNSQIFNTAIAFSRLRAGVHDNVLKVVETDIRNQ